MVINIVGFSKGSTNPNGAEYCDDSEDPDQSAHFNISRTFNYFIEKHKTLIIPKTIDIPRLH